ncbi:hypothetical protein [Streptomyces sp. NBC_01614]|uniref:Uncharacterized protein n=1 Tax=Streptomyces sp. NBC_00180 TaxID=2903632 RepID=A0AAU1IBK6_9ACTN
MENDNLGYKHKPKPKSRRKIVNTGGGDEPQKGAEEDLDTQQTHALGDIMNAIREQVNHAKLMHGAIAFAPGYQPIPNHQFVTDTMLFIQQKYPHLSPVEISSIEDYTWVTLQAKLKRRGDLRRKADKSMKKESISRVRGRTSGERVQLYGAVALITTGLGSLGGAGLMLIQAPGWSTLSANAPPDQNLTMSGGRDPAWATGQWQGAVSTGNYTGGAVALTSGIAAIGMGIGLLRAYMGWCTQKYDTIHRQDIDRENAADGAAPHDEELDKIADDDKEAAKEWAKLHSETYKLRDEIFLASSYPRTEDESKTLERVTKLKQVRSDLAKLEALVAILERLRAEAEQAQAAYYDTYRANHPV